MKKIVLAVMVLFVFCLLQPINNVFAGRSLIPITITKTTEGEESDEFRFVIKNYSVEFGILFYASSDGSLRKWSGYSYSIIIDGNDGGYDGPIYSSENDNGDYSSLYEYFKSLQCLETLEYDQSGKWCITDDKVKVRENSKYVEYDIYKGIIDDTGAFYISFPEPEPILESGNWDAERIAIGTYEFTLLPGESRTFWSYEYNQFEIWEEPQEGWELVSINGDESLTKAVNDTYLGNNRSYTFLNHKISNTPEPETPEPEMPDPETPELEEPESDLPETKLEIEPKISVPNTGQSITTSSFNCVELISSILTGIGLALILKFGFLRKR